MLTASTSQKSLKRFSFHSLTDDNTEMNTAQSGYTNDKNRDDTDLCWQQLCHKTGRKLKRKAHHCLDTQEY